VHGSSRYAKSFRCLPLANPFHIHCSSHCRVQSTRYTLCETTLLRGFFKVVPFSSAQKRRFPPLTGSFLLRRLHIQQVMRGQTSVWSAEDLDSGALTYAEIKAIASGNPAVVEKIKIDTETRKLDQLRAVHANQQRQIRWQIRDLPRHIIDVRQELAKVESEVKTRDITPVKNSACTSVVESSLARELEKKQLRR